jgi:hypothetical protein
MDIVQSVALSGELAWASGMRFVFGRLFSGALR